MKAGVHHSDRPTSFANINAEKRSFDGKKRFFDGKKTVSDFKKKCKYPCCGLLVAGDAAALCVAGVALGDIHLRFTWQAWHLETSTFVLLGTRGTGLALVALLGWDWSPGDAAALCVAGLALGDIHLRFAWQAWHLWHWAGSGGALGLGSVARDAATPCVAGVVLGHIYFRFAWHFGKGKTDIKRDHYEL